MSDVIICPNDYKEKYLNACADKHLHDFKFMTIDEFVKNYYFSYDKRAIYYLMKKYNLNIDVAKVYLNNIYYVDENKKYKNNKLIFLQKIKRELISNNLLIYNDILKKYIDNKIINVINYYNLDKYLEELLKYKIDYSKLSRKIDVHEFKTIEEEVVFVCIEIINLINNGVNINKIFLTNVSDEYYYILKKIFTYFKIPINIDFKDSIYGTNIVQDYLNTHKLDLEDNSKRIVNKKIVDVLNQLIDIDINDSLYDEILKDSLKNTYLNPIKLNNAVNIKDFYSYSFNDDEYVFVLGFNLDSLPKTYKDINFLSDRDKIELNLYDTNYLNKREKGVVEHLISKIKNITISYKLSSPFQKFYPSNLISDLKLNVVREHNYPLNYSNQYNKIKLGELLDKYNLYGEKDSNLDLLYNTYDIGYNSYDNQFTGIDNDLYLDNISYPLKISYTSLNNYNECRFKYYINHVLKINDYTDTFQAFIGQMYHYILTLYKRNIFNLDVEFNKYLEKRELSLKEKLLLVKIKKDLVYLIDVLKKQQLLTGYDDELYEQMVNIEIRKDISVTFIGFIDKIMYYKNMDDTYFSIIDYKTGTIDTSIELMKYGLHAQLPTYLYLINYSNIISNPIFTGIYYQNILFNYPTWSKKIDKEIEDRYLLKGYSTDNVDILERFDTTYEDSKYIKSMKYNPDKGFGVYSKIINDNTMYNIVKYMDNHIKEKANEILSGNFEIDPKIYEGNNISCKYCEFRDLCFMSNNNIKYLDKVDDLSFLGGEE